MDDEQNLYTQEPSLVSRAFPIAVFAVLTIILIIALISLFGN